MAALSPAWDGVGQPVVGHLFTMSSSGGVSDEWMGLTRQTLSEAVDSGLGDMGVARGWGMCCGACRLSLWSLTQPMAFLLASTTISRGTGSGVHRTSSARASEHSGEHLSLIWKGHWETASQKSSEYLLLVLSDPLTTSCPCRVGMSVIKLDDLELEVQQWMGALG